MTKDNIKVLIITYYWPPSGGAGVQRWVKLTKYLHQYNIIPYVLTVDEKYASYLQIDKSLDADVTSHVHVYRTKSFEPINLYAKIVGKKNVPTAGFSNVDNSRITQKIVNAIRSNFFIPDPRKGWNKFAYRKAVEIIEKENIQLIITTSPPHSTQLIGLELQRKLKVKWIADLRDTWTDIYYYQILGHSLLSRSIDRRYEKNVLLHADQILTVSDQFMRVYARKYHVADSSKYHVIPNGYDAADFEGLTKERSSCFTICYTGTMSDIYDPGIVFESIKSLSEQHPGIEIKLQCVGYLSQEIRDQVREMDLPVEIIATVPHDKVVAYQKNADLLLLIIPNADNSAGILPGKLFEYMATGNRILCISSELSDASRILERCGMGKTFDRNSEPAILEYMNDVLQNYREGRIDVPNWKEIKKYSRDRQAGEVREIVEKLV